MKTFIIKTVKIIFTVICISFFFSGISDILSSNSKQDSVLSSIIFTLIRQLMQQVNLNI